MSFSTLITVSLCTGLRSEHITRHRVQLATGEQRELAAGTRLGCGQQGEVMRIADEHFTDCCIKIFKRHVDFEQELSVLRDLQDGVPGVVKFRGCEHTSNIIMTSPALKKTLQQYKGDAACLRMACRQLVRTLQAVHDKGYAYRDFRGTNVLVEQLPSNAGFKCRIFLTDFGSTVRLQESCLYEGTLRHCAQTVLKSLKENGRQCAVACTRATELEALVKMVYILEEKNSLSLDDINPAAMDSCGKLWAWWQNAEESDIDDRTLSRLMSARSANYALLYSM